VLPDPAEHAEDDQALKYEPHGLGAILGGNIARKLGIGVSVVQRIGGAK
jgi:hypothetical protein